MLNLRSPSPFSAGPRQKIVSLDDVVGLEYCNTAQCVFTSLLVYILYSLFSVVTCQH